jgi:serine/threonine-protein kinase RsbT
MSTLLAGKVEISSEGDIVTARKVAREVATGLGFGITDVTRVVTAASELARNVFHYARSGMMTWQRIESNGRTGIELCFIDEGPGIANLELAMTPGHSTGGGLGMGLSGSKRLMDELEIWTEVGKGTKVTIRKWLKRT